MKTTKTELHLRPQFGKLATREQGAKALEQVASLLERFDHVVLDFGQAAATPSFVDELIGGLVDSLGESSFSRRISLAEIDPSLEPLARHVVLHRSRRARAAACG